MDGDTLYCAEYKLMKVREVLAEQPLIERPEDFYSHWLKTVPDAPWFQTEKECCVVFFRNTRGNFTGLELISLGTLDSALVHPREVFRAAIVHGAHSIVLSHNHPSGDPTPSEADIRITRELIRAGQILKLDLADHIVVGTPHPSRTLPYVSLRNVGYFYN